MGRDGREKGRLGGRGGRRAKATTPPSPLYYCGCRWTCLAFDSMALYLLFLWTYWFLGSLHTCSLFLPCIMLLPVHYCFYFNVHPVPPSFVQALLLPWFTYTVVYTLPRSPAILPGPYLVEPLWVGLLLTFPTTHLHTLPSHPPSALCPHYYPPSLFLWITMHFTTICIYLPIYYTQLLIIYLLFPSTYTIYKLLCVPCIWILLY